MGKTFGNLARLRGIIFFRLSPHEQNPFAGLFSVGFPNFVRRCKESVPIVVPPFVFTYLIYDWAKKEHHRLSHKDPKEFENDV